MIAPGWKTLSDVDRRFLLAMARDDGPSTLAAIAMRLGCDSNYAGVYRHRLIKAGMIAVPSAAKWTSPTTRHATGSATEPTNSGAASGAPSTSILGARSDPELPVDTGEVRLDGRDLHL